MARLLVHNGSWPVIGEGSVGSGLSWKGLWSEPLWSWPYLHWWISCFQTNQVGFEDKGDYNIARTVLSPVNAISLVARRQVASRSYVGCIKNVEIARSNFDLLRDAHGVRKGCILKVSSDYTSPSYPTSTCWKSFSCSLTGHHLIVGVFSGLLQGLYIRI